MSVDPNPALYQEYSDPADEAILKKLIPLITDTIAKSYDSGLTYRDTHSKGHAAVRAEFIVDPDLPADLAIGLFAKAKTYPCWVRFSNLDPTPQSDMIPDARACGIKLMGVEGEILWSNEPAAQTMDFLMMGTPALLAPNLSAFYDFQVALNQGGWRLAWYFFMHLSTTMTIQDGAKPTPSLLESSSGARRRTLSATRPCSTTCGRAQETVADAVDAQPELPARAARRQPRARALRL